MSETRVKLSQAQSAAKRLLLYGAEQMYSKPRECILQKDHKILVHTTHNFHTCIANLPVHPGLIFDDLFRILVVNGAVDFAAVLLGLDDVS